MIRRYSELIRIKSFEDRIKYLELNGSVGNLTFGGHRDLNQRLYTSPDWRSLRRRIILRDNGMDLAHPDYEICRSIYIHHINPITIEDILEWNPIVFDEENLVCCSFQTHNRIHYGIETNFPKQNGERSPNDTCPWRL